MSMRTNAPAAALVSAVLFAAAARSQPAAAPSAAALAPAIPAGAPAIDVEYTDAIRKHTTDECFSTPFVDHLPASDVVPSPMEVLGQIAGAPDVLHYSHQVHDYMRAVADASPRVRVFSAGTSEEG